MWEWMGRQGKWNVFRVQNPRNRRRNVPNTVTSGEQAVFRTVEELTLAVQSGVVGPTAEVTFQTPIAGCRWNRPGLSDRPGQAGPCRAGSEFISPQPVTQPPVSLAPIPGGDGSAIESSSSTDTTLRAEHSNCSSGAPKSFHGPRGCAGGDAAGQPPLPPACS